VSVVSGAEIRGSRVVHADVCVIGSGAGGAPVAKELAEGGMRVVVLEEGGHVTTDQLTARPRDMLTRLYRDGGQMATVGAPPIVLPVGRAIGGTTLVNSGTCFRTPEPVMHSWRHDLGLEHLGPGSLDRFYDQVERELGVAAVRPDLAGRNALVAKRGADALGWSGGFVRRNARGCQGSGVCAFGCPTGAKQHVGVTYMPKAWAAGATTFTGVRARRVTLRGGRARGVEALTAGGGRLWIVADAVVVAAGTLQTPGILSASGIAAEALGRHLSVHPATAVWALMDEEVDMARGVPQSYYVDEFADEGIMLEGIAGPPDYVAMAVPFAGPRHRELMLRYRNMAQFGLMVSDRSRGWISGSRLARWAGRPVVRYDLGAADAAKVKQGVLRLAEMFWAAGARTVVTPIGRARELRGGDSGPLARLDIRPGELKLMGFHPLGTARAAARRDAGVVDANLRVHGVGGLYVSDGSVVPSALGVNPQLTIMALATRLAHHILEAECRS
jgi:choline dehydrogenase-like flavoprotein